MFNEKNVKKCFYFVKKSNKATPALLNSIRLDSILLKPNRKKWDYLVNHKTKMVILQVSIIFPKSFPGTRKSNPNHKNLEFLNSL